MEKLESVFEIIKTLRNPDRGCPWDREQTPISMWKCLIEESYELRDWKGNDYLLTESNEMVIMKKRGGKLQRNRDA